MGKVCATDIGGVTDIGKIVVGTAVAGLGEPTGKLGKRLVVAG